MSIKQIQYVVAVYETRSFTLAAKRCFVAQPSLSKSIQSLEKELGSDLFIRDGTIKATKFLDMIYPMMKQMLVAQERVNTIAKQFTLLKSIPIAIGLMQTIGPKKMMPILEALRQQYPYLEIELYFDTKNNLIKRCEMLELDIIVIDAIDYNNGSLFSNKVLYSESYHVVFNECHKFSEYDKVQLKQLNKEVYLDRILCEMRTVVLDKLSAKNVELYASYRSESEQWIQELVEQGIGIAIVPEFSIVNPKLQSRKLTQPSIKRDVYVVYLNSQKNNPKIQAFEKIVNAF